ncbi:MAG TPA: outer membrane lipoprotein carrier protein LolA [Nitrospiria bacterium]|nr:outer membrane lipoprotein carrier protein LolA [Nitrospiria bacterium]
MSLFHSKSRGMLLVGLAGLFELCGRALAAPLPVGDTFLAGLIQNIQTAYEQTTDWRAEFQQVTQIEGFDSPINSRGTVYIKKPGKLRWDYLEPNRHQILVNEEKIWIYTPEQKQVIVSPFAEISDSQLPLHLLSGVGRLDRDFTVQWSDPTRPPPQGPPALTLIPKDPNTGLTKLLMNVDPVTYFITRLTLFEANGNQSRFQFTRIRNDTGLKDRFFVFTPPADVVVVESPLRRP